MSNKLGLYLLPLLIVPTLAGPADACGPDFPPQHLASRSRVLLDMPSGSFAESVSKLVKAEFPFRVVSGEPEGVRDLGSADEKALYDEGARAFLAEDPEQARLAFEALLRLPSEKRRHRSTWSAYMLGRLHADAWRSEKAIAAYRRVRSLAKAGYRDDLGLAAASLGDEAVLHHREGRIEERLSLYAQQASLGDRSGMNSLLLIVRGGVGESATLDLIDSPIGARLVAVYLDTRDHELTTKESNLLWQGLLRRANSGAESHLAALAYRRGQWKMAADFAAKAPDEPRATWVRAKLALRAGDRQRGARLLAEVRAHGLSRANSCNVSTQTRLVAEQSALSVAEGSPLKALELAWSHKDIGNELDIVFIAERLVSVDDLQGFVDRLRPRGAKAEAWLSSPLEPEYLSWLLARRFMREGVKASRKGDYWLALRGFSSAQLYMPAEYRAAALEFATSILSLDAALSIANSEHLYRASRVAREQGMEIMGTVHAPDWGIYDGNFDLSFAMNLDLRQRQWFSAKESELLAASAPVNPNRFHYRSLASDLAHKASARLPHRSQAFAMTLCHAGRYVFGRHPERVRELWNDYVAHGPAAVSMEFGRRCEEPDFSSAARYTKKPRRVPVFAWFVGLPLILGLGVLIRLRMARGVAMASLR